MATYWQDHERSSQALQIIARSAPDFEVIDVAPPAGAIGPVVIHGSSESAEATAKRIAYDLYTELGDWVVVRPVQMTNHSYSKDYIGIYLLDEETAKMASDDRRRSFVVVPSNEYLPTRCDHFSGPLFLDVADSADVPAVVSVRVPHPVHVVGIFNRVLVDVPTDLRSSVGQVHMQSLPAVGREDLHFAAGGMQPVAVRCDDSEASSLAPLEEIKRLASETRIVIVNEGHDRPIHRKFIGRIAAALMEEGYTIFAAETFIPFIAEQSGNTEYASVTDGYYSDEPVFGQLLRQVKRSGYKLRDYEYRRSGQSDSISRWQRASDREEGQANNIVAILDDLEPDDRLLVHVGYSHASEIPIRSFDGKSLAWMAARLKEKTGINPLTIDQTGCHSGTDAPRLMTHSARHVDGQFDLVVGHPELSFQQGRPMYRLSENHSLVKIPRDLFSSDSRVIVEARFVGEPIDAVPVDRLMLWPGEAIPLVLPQGKFELISFEEHSELRRVMNIEVNGAALSE